jgi:hypothetical protein
MALRDSFRFGLAQLVIHKENSNIASFTEPLFMVYTGLLDGKSSNSGWKITGLQVLAGRRTLELRM